MVNKDSGWRPKGGLQTFEGHEVWEYEIGPHQINPGEVDGEVTLDYGDADPEEFKRNAGSDEE